MAKPSDLLENYANYAVHVRLATASNYVENLNTRPNPKAKKLFMVRLIDEMLAQVEDYALWLDAVRHRNQRTRGANDVWQHVLMQHNSYRTLRLLGKNCNNTQLLRKLRLPSVPRIAELMNLDIEDARAMVTLLSKIVEYAYVNAEENDQMLSQFHNKIKHGMMVIETNDGIDIVTSKLGKDDTIEKRHMSVRTDIVAAQTYYDNMESAAQAIRFLVRLLAKI
jgi:hypothetical protein